MNSLDQSFSFFLPLEGQDMLQRFLYQHYKSNSFREAKAFSYNNTTPLSHYWKLGRLLFEQADSSPLALQPLLYFYGFVDLLKGTVLLYDPHYPSSSHVLAHGVSTRKRKKRSYCFLDDEVKIQKNGLFSHTASVMFHMKHVEGEKWSMGHLLLQIPELYELFTFIHNYPPLLTVEFHPEFFEIKSQQPIGQTERENVKEWISKKEMKAVLKEEGSSVLSYSSSLIENSAFKKTLLQDHENRYYLLPDVEKHTGLHELLVHYLLLYNLSMICRYETEWWGELITHQTTSDFSFIKAYLALVREKVPFLFQPYYTP
ncbi:YaaC family protein [Thalassobacillus sp. C254]|uniref:YaaC family protein n=1 Tax=Thalassobacillus sp. C254 TaxID=1225341 RepID=UPI0006D28148|nr:YaaC family protein [Thalassobacillus sp. C254]